jgi:RHS repeat-associated protein
LPNGTTQSFVWDSDNNQVTFTDQIGTSHIYQFDASAVLSAYTVMPANHQPITTEFVATGSLVTEIINPLNQKHRYSYDAEGFMTSSTDPLGNTTLYEWDPITKQRTKIITPLNQRWRFTWSPFGKPVCLTDPLGNKTQYTYDATGALVAQTDQKGRQTKYVFDETSSFIRQLIDASGHISSFTYDGRGNITRAADPLGRTTAFEYDAADRLIKTIAPDGSFVTMEYDFADNLILRRDHLGRETKIEYNVNNQPVLITNPDNTTIAFSYDDLGRKISVIDPLGRETKFEYGPYNKDSDPGRVTKITYPDNVVELFEYDAVGRLISSRDGIGHKTTFEYDAKGQLIAIVDPAGNRLESTYDSVGRLVARKDPLGRITSFEYDRLDRLVKTTFPDGSRNAYSYDSVGNLLSTKDPMGNTWAFKYDALDRLIRSIQPNGASSSVVFDPAGQLLATIDPLKRKNRFSYDVMGRLTTTQNPLNSAWRYEYDSAGRLVATTNPLNKTATATYDIMDRLVAASDYLGRATTMEYDSAGRLIAKTDALGRRSIVAYDARNRIIAETDPEGQTVTFSYDQAGRLVRRTDATNRTWQWEYDSLGRAIASVDPLGNRVAYAYDAAGNQISKTNARNETTQYEYNPRNQLVLVRYPDNTVATFTYDFIGREISRSGPTGYVQKKWDSVGNLLSEKFSVGANRNDPKGWSYSYDLVGNRINAVDPNGGTYAYEYNALNQLSKLDPPGHTNAVQYRYDLTGFMIDSERQGLKSFLQYDPNGRLLDIRHERTHGFPKVIASRRYTYDAVGNPLSMLDEAGKITQYAYNGADWLTSVSYPDGQNVSYDYDESGNRLREITGAMAVSFVYDVAGRMIARASDTFTYDPDGNLVTARENGKETRYSWSSENQLLKVIKDNPCPVHQAKKCRCPWAQAEQEEYSYLPEDWRRVTRKTGSLSFVSFYDGADESHEYVEIPNLFTRFDLMKWCKAPKLPKRVLFREFISGPGSDDMEAVRYHGRDLAILKDGLGSTIAIANTRGYPIARMNYDVWGNFRWPEKKGHGVAPCKETDLDGILERLEGKFIFGVPNHDPDHYGRHFAKVLTPYLFAGRRLDTFSGLYNSRNRYYNPTVGRFMSSDPIGFAGDGNLWAYARSNPARYTDPFGLMSPGDIVTFNVSSLGGLSYTSESLARLTQGFFEYAQTDPLVIALQNQGKQVELEFAGQVMLAGSQAKNNAIITNAMNMIAQSRSYYQNRLCQVNGNRSIYSDIGTNGPFVSLFGNDEDFTLPPLPKLPGYQPLYPETNVLEELENRELQERFEARGDTGNPENFLRMAELAIIFGSLAPGGQGVKAIGQGVKAIGQGGKLLTGPRAISEATRNVARSYSDKVLKRGLKDAVQEINRHKKILKNADPRQIRSITEDLLKHEGRLQSFIEELQRRGVPIDF